MYNIANYKRECNVKMTTQIFQQYDVCLALAQKYSLSIETIQKEQKEMKNFRVTTPIIGGFSTGKSSLINALLQQNLLKTQITAETAVPTEIYVGENRIFHYKDHICTAMTFEEFSEKEFDEATTDYIQIELAHPQLEQIPSVKIVDMPGFDSGIASHNTAIDRYLPNSLAYIVTFSAEEPVVKESIANFLKELKLHEMPIYVVVTKSDKVTAEQLAINIDRLTADVVKHLGVQPKKVVAAWSKRNRNTEGLQQILQDIEATSQNIFQKKYTAHLRQHVASITQYLEMRLKSADLSVSELAEKEAAIVKQMADLTLQVNQEQEKFQQQLTRCIEAIEVKLDKELQQNASLLEDMLVRGADIQGKLNTIVRHAVTVGIKTEFEPKMQKHVQNIAQLMQIETMFDTHIQLDEMKIQTENMVKDLAVKAIPIILAALVISAPVIGAIAAVVTLLADVFLNKKRQNELRVQAQQRIQSEIIPTILQEASIKIDLELRAYTEEVHEKIREDIDKQKELLQQALQDVRNQQQEEITQQKAQKQELEADLKAIGGLVYV